MNRTTYFSAIALGLVIAGAFFAYGAFFGDGTPASRIELATASGTPATPSEAPLGALPPLDATRTPPTGSALYRDTKYRFSVFYPSDLDVKSYDEGLNSSTIVFQNPKEGLGFQVFIVPYGYPQVTQDRFLKDERSGVRENPTNVYVDGVLGVAFYGKSFSIGSTSEVWIIKDGYLYEIVAPRVLASWLANIMSTWKFI